jgi:hypothetical protein
MQRPVNIGGMPLKQKAQRVPEQIPVFPIPSIYPPRDRSTRSINMRYVTRRLG